MPIPLVAFAVTVVTMCAGACGVVAWRSRRTLPSGIPLGMASAGLLVCNLPVLGSVLIGHTTLPKVAASLIMAGEGLVVAGFIGYGVATVDPSWVPRRRHLLLLVEPALRVVVAVLPHLDLADRGYVVISHYVYNYALIISGGVVVVRRVRAHGQFSRQAALSILAIGMLIVSGVVAGVITGKTSLVPPVLIGSMTTGFLVALARGAFQLLPIAQTKISNTIAEAILVLDAEQRLVVANPAARQAIRNSTLPTGARLPDILPDFPALDSVSGTTFDLESDPPAAIFEVRVDVLTSRRGSRVGWMLVGRDVTKVRRQHEALEASNEQLRTQLGIIDGLRRDLAEQAIRDALTGLHNRRYLMEILSATNGALALSTLAILDVDHFKRVNDEWGHPAGDEVLRHIARVLQNAQHHDEVIARYGGEEFVVLMPGRSLAQGRDRIDTLRRQLEESPVTISGRPLTVTFSAGVASTQCQNDASQALDLADRALYRAKRGGRNRVESAAEDSVAVHS